MTFATLDRMALPLTISQRIRASCGPRLAAVRTCRARRRTVHIGRSRFSQPRFALGRPCRFRFLPRSAQLGTVRGAPRSPARATRPNVNRGMHSLSSRGSWPRWPAPRIRRAARSNRTVNATRNGRRPRRAFVHLAPRGRMPLRAGYREH